MFYGKIIPIVEEECSKKYKYVDNNSEIFHNLIVLFRCKDSVFAGHY